MAAILLLPGMGGKYVSEDFSADATGADTIDASRCIQLAIQVEHVTGSPSGTVQLQQSFGAGWSNLGNSLSVNTDGNIGVLDVTGGPLGLLRLVVDIGAATAVRFHIVGYEAQTIA